MPSYMQYKRQMAVLDADNSEIESWITVRGNHIPIMKGQSKEEAVKSFIESKSKGDGGKHYITTKQHGDTRYVNPKNNEIVRTKAETTPFGSKLEAQSFAHKLNHTDPYAGTPFATKNYERKQFPFEVESEEQSKYEPEFETVRKNALANSSLYGGRYTQKSKAEAYKEYKKDTGTKKTIGEMESGGLDVTNIKRAMQHVNYGFYEEQGKKMTPEEFKSYLSSEIEKTKGKNDYYSQRVQQRYPEALKMIEPKESAESRTPAEKHAATRNILNLFHENYNNLYEGKTKHNSSLVKEFDDKMAKDPEFKAQVQAFVKERGDVLSSDREVEAYMLAYNKVKNKLEPAMHKLEQSTKGTVTLKDPKTGKEIQANINDIKADDNTMPSVGEYSKYLDTITSKTGMSREDARNKYGQYTIKQWNDLLNKK